MRDCKIEDSCAVCLTTKQHWHTVAQLLHWCRMSADDTALSSLQISSQWTLSSSNLSCESPLLYRQGTEAERIQLRTSKPSVCWHLLKSRAIKPLHRV